MSKEYYYLISSLPQLKIGEKAPFSSEQFLGQCQGYLTEEELSHLSEISEIPSLKPCNMAEKSWVAWETYLRNILLEHRAIAKKVDSENWLKETIDVFPGDRKQIEELLSNANPAIREKGLDSLRWKQLDNCGVRHPFDLSALIIYRIKLLIVEKWEKCNQKNGLKYLDQLVSVAAKQAEKVRTLEDI